MKSLRTPGGGLPYVLVSELMTPNPTIVHPDAPLIDALELMVRQRFRHLPVVSRDGELVGILSDRDLKAALPDRFRPKSHFEEVVQGTRIDQVMTRDPITVSSKTPLINAIAVMLSCRVGSLPVLDDDQLVGILSQADIMRRYGEELASRECNPDGSHPSQDLADAGGRMLPPRVFILSPDAQVRSLLTDPLVDLGFTVESFDTVQEVLPVWQLVLPDLLVVDQRFETNPNLHLFLRTAVPVLRLTALAQGCLLEGGGQVRALPCPDEDLAAFLTDAVGDPAPIRADRSSRPARILVAEDDHVIRKILTHHLGRHGFELAEAHDGREATELLASHSFDLLLLDINMPHTSGLEILKTLRNAEKVPKRVILTSSHQDETVMEAFSLGADDFVKKPFSPDALIRRLERLLDRA